MKTRRYGELRVLLAKLPEGTNVDEELLDQHINAVVQDIVLAYNWTHLQKTAQIQTVAQYSSIAVSIDSGATSGSGLGTTFTPEMDGRRIRIAGTAAFYRFGYVDATNFTIDRGYEDATDVAKGAFRIWQAVYDLPPDVDFIKSIEVPSRRWDLDEKSREWLNRRDAARILYGDPRTYVLAEDSTDGSSRVELYPGPEKAEALTLEYQATVPPLVEADTLIPSWITMSVLWAGAVAALNGMPLDKATVYQRGLKMMIDSDHIQRPPVEFQMADRFIEHRIRRGNNRRSRWRSW